MIRSACQHEHYQKNGTTKAGATRYRCTICGKSWTEFTQTFEGMRIGLDLATKIVSLLCEGMSVAATARLTGTYKQTVIDLLLLVGGRCEAFLKREIKAVHVDDIQADEIWQFVLCKHATAQRQKYVGGCGDSYCYTAIERNTKLLVAWHLGRRNEQDTHVFCGKLDQATTGRFHLSTDGFQCYPFAVLRNLRNKVDYGMLVKIFSDSTREDQRKYSPPRIVDSIKRPIMGNPDFDRVCTSHAERMNGTIRNYCKRMGRLTYCFSKRWYSHQAALGLFFANYNYCRKHKSLKGQTPAMAHGIADHTWTVRELLEKVSQLNHT